ncbi:hypothetical protein DelCs14_1794 [Delftia sp. Cs1-4]|uniref:hypothetical protein n=1 Tax=Delftia sp. (strain Cs1-4) TaxID=742013 RepID=UPI00020E7BE4|nr:hypothetical protein [Delftia sp. Cs1-4]AEF88819.1 hypothetical protein DelCs14_1794 [Delftia sp. Cs1-4]
MANTAGPDGLTQEQKHLWLDELRREVRSAADGRVSDVRRGGESPAVSAALFDKFGRGICTAAHVLGLDTGALQREVDALSREIDPDFDANRQARWAARPAAFSFERA